MSRTHKAGIIATFGYLQFALAFVSGIVMLPFILGRIGTENYGLWLACGELLAYSAMVDVGVLGVLPWLIAEKDGQGDRQAIRDLISNGVAVACVISVLYFLAALMLWQFATRIVDLTETQRQALTGPLLLVMTGTAIAFPLRTFYTVLLGLQDAVFTGVLSIAQWALNIIIILTLLIKGYGLYALAVAAVVPTLLVCLLCLIRTRMSEPELLAGWRRPAISQMLYLLKQGFGVWVSALGWRMVAASNSIVILSIGTPEMVVVYACTAKLGEILMPLSWQLSDSGLVGLAQLHGEGVGQRVREVVLAMLRLLLIGAGGVAVLMLALNHTFVTLWVGADKFGGLTLTSLLAATVIGLSLVHGIIVPAAVMGDRFQIGMVTLIQGGVNLLLALGLGSLFGLRGVAMAGLCSSFLIAFPLGMRFLKRRTGLSLRVLSREVFRPWLLRLVALFAISLAIGIWLPHKSLIALLCLAPLLGCLYVWHMRPLYIGIPVPLRVKPWLMRIRLIPQQ